MIWYILSVILVILSGSIAYKSDIEGTLVKITSERFATINEFPSSVSIQQTPFYHKCTGVILNQYYILTAAHCFWPEPLEIKNVPNIKTYYVVTGTHNVSRSRVYNNYHRIEKVFIHKEYFTDADLDMAVIKVVGSINLNRSTQKAAEFASRLELFGIIKYNVTGWGFYDPRHKTSIASNMLRLATFESFSFVPDVLKFIGVSLEYNVNACKGDSGAGAFLNNKLIGIVSGGKCTFSLAVKQYTVFVNVLLHKSQSFIKKILANKCPKKSVMIINNNLDWDPVFEKTDTPGTATNNIPMTHMTGLQYC